MDKYDELKSMVESLGLDIQKFSEKGNKAAGTRARKTLQDVKKLSQEIRLAIQDMKKA